MLIFTRFAWMRKGIVFITLKISIWFASNEAFKALHLNSFALFFSTLSRTHKDIFRFSNDPRNFLILHKDDFVSNMCQDLKSNSSVKPILNTHSAEMVTTPITITNIASSWPKCNGTSFHMYVYVASQRSE